MRISNWREETGCRNVKPFKYSGETSASSDVHANLNEVITSYDGGGEVLDDKEEPLDLSGMNSLPAFRYKPSKKEERRKERRREKRRRQRLAASMASYKGLRLEVSGGERKRLKWTGRRRGRGSVKPQPPPFDLLLSSVEESSLVPHSSGEARTESGSDQSQLTFSDLPSSRSRPPPPLHHDSSPPVRRNYKRRHQS